MTNPRITQDANPLNVGQPVAPPPTPSDITPPAPVDPALTPKPEQTARQDTLWNGAAMMGGLPGMAMGGIAPGAFYGSSPVMGGTADTAPFYNGFGAIGLNAYGVPLGTWANYFLMERNPTVALAEATADAPIRAAEITYECREGTPAEVVDWVKGQFEHSERDLLDQFVYARGWGCRQAELVYKYDPRAGAIVFDKAKWLMPELTTALRDQHGNLVGLDNQGTQITDPRRFLWVTYDGKGCNPYGRSRKENCKKPWLREEGLYDILEYAMNIQVRPFGYVEYPYGLKDAAGNSINDQMKANAAAIASNLAQGKFGLVPNPFAPWMEEMITKGIDISKIMPYKIGWYDAKTDSGEGFERLLGLTNRGIVMGILQPPRSILEGPGTQADAGVHTDTGVMVNEIFLQNLCLAVNKGPIDTVLVQRYGEEYRGCVYWKPAPMVDKQMSFNNELVKTVMGGPMGPYLQKRVIQLASIFEKSGVKINEFDQEQLAEDYEKEQADKRAIELDAAQAKGGKGDGKGGKDGDGEALSLSTAGGGHWITIGADEEEGGGTHVFIEGGRITKGPKGLQGKDLSDLPSRHRTEAREARHAQLKEMNYRDIATHAHALGIDHRSLSHRDLQEHILRSEGHLPAKVEAAPDRFRQHIADRMERRAKMDKELNTTDRPEAAPKEAARVEQSEKGHDDTAEPKTPREKAAEHTVESKSDYAFARQSAVGNVGEDLADSARHKRNAWRGLADAEANGTAESMVTRDQLMKHDPHALAEHADTNPMTALAMHYAIKSLPPKPGYGSRNNGSKDRGDYHQTYQSFKAKAEELAKTEPNAGAALEKLRTFVGDKISSLREQDRYNNTANALTGTHKDLYSRSYKKNSVSGKLAEFTTAYKAKYGTDAEATPLDKARDFVAGKQPADSSEMTAHIKNILSGSTVNETLGVARGPSTRKFDPADLYIGTPERTGGPDVSDLTQTAALATKSMVDKFGMRGVQWGNSVTDDEREHHSKHLIGALTDLAVATGLHPQDISLGGKLGIAVGARGKGSASAHYEPGSKVINMTRTGGVGTLAHEWGHALDHHLAGGGISSDGEKARGDYMSKRISSQRFVKAEDGDKSVHGYKTDEHGKMVTEDASKDPVWAAMNNVRQAMNTSGFNKRLGSVMSELNRSDVGLYKGREYWGSNEEKFARSFERHVTHKLGESSQKNTYLSGLGGTDESASDAVKTYSQLWPSPAESAHMAPAMDALLAAYRQKTHGSADVVKMSAEEIQNEFEVMLSTADTLLDDAVDSHHRLTPDERKRRKQFLLLLLGYFSWQSEALAAGTETADTPRHTAKLAHILATGMQREAVAGLVADSVTVPHLNTLGEIVNTQAQHVAEQLNATTAKNIATAIANGKSLMEAIDQIATTAMEARASVIEEDMTYLALVIADRVELDIAQKESVWICADDDKVCSVCGPLHGLVAKAGEPFAPGIYYPVVNTHSRCRCRIEAVPDAPNL